MKKVRRFLIGCTAATVTFFLSAVAGTSTNLTAEVFNRTSTNNEDNIFGPSTYDLTTPSLSPAPTVELSLTSTPDQSSILSPTQSPTPTPSPTPTATATPTPTPTPTLSPTPTVSPTPTISPTPTLSPTPTPQPLTLDFTIPSVITNLHIRSGPSTNYKIIGKLSGMSYAYVLEVLPNGWTKISTGTIEEGYVSSDYLFSQEDIISLCDRENLVSGTTTAGVNVRSGPGTFYDVKVKVTANNTYPVILSQSYEGWYAIEYKTGKIGYVSAKYLTLNFDLDTGYSMAELQHFTDLKDLENQLGLNEGDGEKVYKAMLTSVPETKRNPITVTDEELELFATVICTEAGNQPYEGMLAVANVILNRLEYGKWGNTLEEVIYAKGQFAGAAPEYMERARARGIPANCYKAAREALAGRNNIGNFRYFRTIRTAKRDYDFVNYTSFIIIEDHVFYFKDW